jgi:carotenoid cleavage dioxygenase-like enzyme
MAWLSVQAPSAEGVWNNLRTEGKLPRDLNGTLFRTASGQKENNGTRLKHLFEGTLMFRRGRFKTVKPGRRHPGVKMVVDAAGNLGLQFLDANGKVIYSLPESNNQMRE